MGIMRDVIAPAQTVLHRLEMRGMPLDIGARNELRTSVRDDYEQAVNELGSLVQPYHYARCERITVGIDLLVMERFHVHSPACCKKHPEYTGITNRSKSKCADCRNVYTYGTEARKEYKVLSHRISKGKQRLKQIGGTFKDGSDDHWRFVLFNKELGCGLRPGRRTKVRKDPQVDDDAIVALQKKYPDNPLLQYRVRIQSTLTRLATRLAVEPAEDGRVHFAYSMSRSGPGRISSGKDDEEYDKFRNSPGNAQNIAPRDRVIYRALQGMVFIEGDWSQIEARRTAGLANEQAMLQAWRDGADIHAINGAALAQALGMERCSPSQAKELTFRFQGEMHTYRYAAKRMTHGWNYGMGAAHTAELFGLTIAVAQRLIDAYFKQWPMLLKFQHQCVATANRDRQLVNSWGRVYPFTRFAKDRDTGKWVISDPNEAISFLPQSDISDLCKKVLPPMDKCATLWGGELLNTKHDSFTSMIPHDNVGHYIDEARRIMEHEYIEGFTCPSDFEVGLNWGPHHKHSALTCGYCAQPENLDGMRPWRGVLWFYQKSGIV